MNPGLNHFFPESSYSPPDQLVLALEKRFGKLLNVEWYEEDGGIEAVFYCNDLEHIARFDASGGLQVVKRNQPLRLVTSAIARKACEVGELMNLIEIDREGELFYEIIARDKQLDRYYLLLREDGTLVEKRKL